MPVVAALHWLRVSLTRRGPGPDADILSLGTQDRTHGHGPNSISRHTAAAAIDNGAQRGLHLSSPFSALREKRRSVWQAKPEKPRMFGVNNATYARGSKSCWSTVSSMRAHSSARHSTYSPTSTSSSLCSGLHAKIGQCYGRVHTWRLNHADVKDKIP